MTTESLPVQTSHDLDRTCSIQRLPVTQGRTVFEIPSPPVGIWFTVRPWSLSLPRRRLRCVPWLTGAPPRRTADLGRPPVSLSRFAATAIDAKRASGGVVTWSPAPGSPGAT